MKRLLWLLLISSAFAQTSGVPNLGPYYGDYILLPGRQQATSTQCCGLGFYPNQADVPSGWGMIVYDSPTASWKFIGPQTASFRTLNNIRFATAFPSVQSAVNDIGVGNVGLVINPPGGYAADTSNTGPLINELELNNNLGVASGTDLGGMRLLNYIAATSALSASKAWNTLLINNHVASTTCTGCDPTHQALVNSLKILARRDSGTINNIHQFAFDCDLGHSNNAALTDEDTCIFIVNSALGGASDFGGVWGADIHVQKVSGAGDGTMKGIEIGMHKVPSLGAAVNYGIHIYCADSSTVSGTTDCGDAIHVGANPSSALVANWTNIAKAIDKNGTTVEWQITKTGFETLNGGLGTGQSTNTDLAGELSFAAATTASFTFLGTYTSHPECTAEPQFDIGPHRHWITYTAATSFTVNFDAAQTGAVTYVCVARN